MASDEIFVSEIGVMEVFILALIGAARLSSLYEFQKEAGLQPGSIRQALRKLESEELIERAESSVRRKRALKLTRFGYEVLNSSWKGLLRDYNDLETVLRAVCIALLMGEVDGAISYLDRQSGMRRLKAGVKEMDTEQLGKAQGGPLSTYKWMRALSEAHRRSAESEALSKVGRTLREKYQPNDHQPR